MTLRNGLGALLCAGLLVVPLVSLRNSHPAADDIALTVAPRHPALSAERSVPRRATRAARPAPTTSTTEAPPTTTTAPPPPTTVVTFAAAVAKPTTTTTRPAPKPTTTTTRPAPKPTTTTAPPSSGGGSNSGSTSGNTESGQASFYRAGYHAESPQWCAHKTLPKGTVVTVTHTGNGRSTTCTVMDRGPYVQGRIIDLSEHTFSQLAPPSAGVIPVRISW